MSVFVRMKVVCIGLVLLACDLRSQDIKFRRLTVDEGLTQNTINVFFQDSRGFLWMGTQDGLNVYDGYQFRVIRHEPGNTNSLSHNWVWDIYQDRDDKFWIATWKGLTVIDPVDFSFSCFLPDSLNPGAIKGDRPVSLVQDSRGYLWVGTWGGGLNRYDPLTGRFKSFIVSEENPDLPGPLVRKLFIDSGGNLWIGTWNGLWKCSGLDEEEYRFRHYRHEPGLNGSLSSNKITCLEEDLEGNIWIGTLEGGVNKMDTADQEFTVLRYDPNNLSTVSSNDISAIRCDRSGAIWVGTVSHGLNRIDPGRENIERYRHDPDDPFGPGADEISSLFVDSSGCLWVGAGGANVYVPYLNDFGHFTGQGMGAKTPGSLKVTAFYEDDRGDIWIGTVSGGVIVYNPATGKMNKWSHSPEQPGTISSNNISSFAVDGSGRLWIGTRGGGLNRLEPASGRFSVIREDRNNPETHGMDYINGLCFHDGILWIATYSEGLIAYDIARNHFRRFTSDTPEKRSISGDYLLRIFRDSRNMLWIGTWGRGLTRYDPARNEFSAYLHREDEAGSISGNIVHAIYETISDTGRIIWVGTENGLSFMDPDTPGETAFTHITSSNGLPGSAVYGILQENRGALWISGNSGLARLDLTTGETRNFSQADGLQSNEFNAGAFYRLRKGMFLFGGINGFNMFYPDSIRQSTYRPKVVLTSFKVFDKEIFPDISVGYIRDIFLKFRQNFFSMEFAALDFSNPAKNMYRYRMEGLDRDWIEAGHRRFASYTNIKPGRYVFRVMGTNSDGVWSSHEARLNIHVSPPYWGTWWFRASVLILLGLLLYTLHKYRVNKVREIERLRVRIASDLHDDIGSALTRITIHSQQIRNEENIGFIRSASEKISELSRNVVSNMSDVVWSIDSRNDTSKDMLDRMLDFAHHTLSSNNIQVSFMQKGLDKNRSIPVLFRQNVFFIFKEAITNILKHSGAGEVTIRLVFRGNAFMMKIADNGRGFDTEDPKYGNGLKNMNMRTERIGGQLTIRADRGTELMLKVPHVGRLK